MSQLGLTKEILCGRFSLVFCVPDTSILNQFQSRSNRGLGEEGAQITSGSQAQ